MATQRRTRMRVKHLPPGWRRSRSPLRTQVFRIRKCCLCRRTRWFLSGSTGEGIWRFWTDSCSSPEWNRFLCSRLVELEANIDIYQEIRALQFASPYLCSVFFELFAAAELSANVCVAMGPCAIIQLSVSLHWHRTVVANFLPGNFDLFRGTPGSHPRNPEASWMVARGSAKLLGTWFANTILKLRGTLVDNDCSARLPLNISGAFVTS